MCIRDSLYSAAESRDLHILLKSLTGGEHNRSYNIVAHVPCNLHDRLSAVIVNSQSISYHRQVFAVKGDIHNRTENLYYSAFFHIRCHLLSFRWNRLLPVSYTHLDVYKRQVFGNGLYSGSKPELHGNRRNTARSGIFRYGNFGRYRNCLLYTSEHRTAV